jgi:hypothetical protein
MNNLINKSMRMPLLEILYVSKCPPIQVAPSHLPLSSSLSHYLTMPIFILKIFRFLRFLSQIEDSGKKKDSMRRRTTGIIS